MKIRDRYRRLGLWSKLAVWGSIASVVGIPLALFLSSASGGKSPTTNQSPILIHGMQRGNMTINYNLFPPQSLHRASDTVSADRENDALQNDWKALLEKGTSQPSSLRRRGPRYSGILAQLDPLDARILLGITAQYASSNKFVAAEWEVNEYEFGLGLQNLERLGLIKMIDSPGLDDDGLDVIYMGTDRNLGKWVNFQFRVRLTALGWDFMRQVGNAYIRDEKGGDWVYIDWHWSTQFVAPSTMKTNNGADPIR